MQTQPIKWWREYWLQTMTQYMTLSTTYYIFNKPLICSVANSSMHKHSPISTKLEELILRIAPTAGQYGKKLPSRFSKMGELNFNIIMFSKGQKKGRLIA